MVTFRNSEKPAQKRWLLFLYPDFKTPIPVRRLAGSNQSQTLSRKVNRIDQGVDFFCGVIEGQAGSHAGSDIQMLMQGHGAMMTVSDCDALSVQERGEIFGMSPVDVEAEDGAPLFEFLGPVNL